jgi:aryl-alcohol dehydrogenase-like predicted oxidoreductase
VAEDIGIITYSSLAAGFLTGKYRSKADLGKSPRGGGVEKFLTPKGEAILAALDKVGQANDATPSEVSIAWILAQKGITAPIASATSVEQVKSLAKGARLKLSEADLAELTAAGK